MYPELTSFVDLEHLNESQAPGVCSIIGIAKDSVTSLFNVLDIMAQVNPLAYPLNSAYNWGVIDGFFTFSSVVGPKFSPDFSIQLLFEETEKSTNQLKEFTYKLLFDLPNDDYATRGQIIQTYDRREWILIVTETSGAKRLIGSMARGADFSSQLTSGSSLKGASKLNCGFIWTTGPERAFYIKS